MVSGGALSWHHITEGSHNLIHLDVATNHDKGTNNVGHVATKTSFYLKFTLSDDSNPGFPTEHNTQSAC